MQHVFVPARPPGWEAPQPAPAWQRWLMGDSRWHLPQDHPAIHQPEHWLLAHPAHFEADLNCLRLNAIQQAPLDKATRTALQSLLLAELADEIQTIETRESILLLRLTRPDNTAYFPLGEVLGEDLSQCMPQGPQALQRAQQINALQMACHGKGLTAQGITGLWFSRPTPIPPELPRPTRILGHGPARAWADALQCSWQERGPMANNDWLWQEHLPGNWPAASRLARWLGRSVHVHAGLHHYWPHRLRRP